MDDRKEIVLRIRPEFAKEFLENHLTKESIEELRKAYGRGYKFDGAKRHQITVILVKSDPDDTQPENNS